MAEQVLKGPGIYEREIELSERDQQPVGTPAMVFGTAEKGPAFVPVTLGSKNDFISKFGNVDPNKLAPYAAVEFLKHRSALTFVKVLGAGANLTDAHISHTLATGKVRNAGVVITGSLGGGSDVGGHNGSVQFIVAKHVAQANEAYGMPFITDNDSFAGSIARMVRGVVFMANDARMMIHNADEVLSGTLPNLPDDVGTVDSEGRFKLIISSSAGSGWAKSDGFVGVRVYTASLNPSSAEYIANVLNTNPALFSQEKHYLYADFAVDDETAKVDTENNSVAVLSGSLNISSASGDTTMPFRDVFGHLDARYMTPATPLFISQPFGTKEYNLFSLESLNDGAYANEKHKVSITNIRASADRANPYGTFSVQVRKFDDTDGKPEVLEQFDNLSLNHLAENYVARAIGDKKVTFNFDDADPNERRLTVKGKYPNRSKYVRIVASDDLENKITPKEAVPFGFRGVSVLKTNDLLIDSGTITRQTTRFGASGSTALTGSIIPPIPFRFKVTRGNTSTAAGPVGLPGASEIINPDLYWGVKFERNTAPLDSNVTDVQNRLIKSLTRFFGISKLDALVTGSGADDLNNNKFTLAKVTLANVTGSANNIVEQITGSAEEHMREAAYIRDGKPDPTLYTIDDGSRAGRITLASILAQTSSVTFNKFSRFCKFSTFMYGGWDGVNILDENASRMNDKGTSIETNGGANSSFTSPGLATNVAGTSDSNNAVASFRAATDAVVDKNITDANLFVTPGIRESYVTDYVSEAVKKYEMGMYIMDVPMYDDNTNRLYDDRTVKPSVEKTRERFDARNIDNNYVASYFPDVTIDDDTNNRRVRVPASVAALAAIGFNDKVAYPWFAPAGFNRGALDFVRSVDVRLARDDRNDLDESRINPIAAFPRTGFVIFGQKTLQLADSALNRVNVRRLLLDVKRVIADIAMNLVFEQNDRATRTRFRERTLLQLGLIQAASGIETFSVVCDETNNTTTDANEHKMNGKVALVPTRAIERVSLDFVITPQGISFA